MQISPNYLVLLSGTYSPPEDADKRINLIKEVIATGAPLHINESKDKTKLRTNIYPIFNDHNEVDRIAVYIKDITQEIEVTKKLLQAEKMAAIGNITSGIVHQIRNPLGNISFAAQLGLQQEDLNETLRDYLELILNDVDQANLVIQKLVEYNDPYAIKLIKGNILNPIYKAISLSNSRMETKNIQLTFDHPDKLPDFKISEYWLEHTFINIINNSIQAIEQDGKIEIIVSMDSAKTNLIVSIKDNGCGIPKNKLNQIYDPFFTTKENGVGLGLSLVIKIVELHNGTVEIESKEKEFTVVTLTFPFRKQQQKYYRDISFPF